MNQEDKDNLIETAAESAVEVGLIECIWEGFITFIGAFAAAIFGD